MWDEIKTVAAEMLHRHRAPRSRTTTPSAATTGPATTGSARSRSPLALRAAKAALDPPGILNPGVLLDP